MTSRISSNVHYLSALKEIERVMRARRGTAQGRKLNALANLIQAYERRLLRRLFG
jgi:hypothetical protein